MLLPSRMFPLLASLLLLTASMAHASRPLGIPDLEGGAASPEALADQLLEALAANDEAALQRLRVSESEYRRIIVPGTVTAGSPPRAAEPAATDFFWRMLDAKSHDFARQLLSELGGKHLTRREIRFTKGTHSFAGYTAHGQLRVAATDESGAPYIVRSGTIAQVGDRYKLIGLNWDD